MIPAANETLTLLREAAQKCPSFAKMMPYNIIEKRGPVSKKTLSRLSKYNDEERGRIETFLGLVDKQNILFWSPLSIQHKFSAKNREALTNAPWSLAAVVCFFLEEADFHQRILGRFARLAVFRLRSEGYTAESIAGVLQGVGLDADAGKIQKYIDSGSKYNHLAIELKGACVLFFLPMSVPEIL